MYNLPEVILHFLLYVKESVCATFGSGLPSACVVDVGDQTTSISCVEDGVSIPSSRYLATISVHVSFHAMLPFVMQSLLLLLHEKDWFAF